MSRTILVAAALAAATTCSAQTWDPPVRISPTANPAHIKYNFGKAVAINAGGLTHFVWVEELAPSPGADTIEVYGQVWHAASFVESPGAIPPRPITPPAYYGWPKVAVQGPNLYVAFHSHDGDGDRQVELLVSHLNGTDLTPSSTPLVASDALGGTLPAVAAEGDLVHLTWATREPGSGVSEIYKRTARSFGASWVDPAPVMVSHQTPGSGDSKTSWTPVVIGEGPAIYFAWTDERHDDEDCGLTGKSDECREELYLRRCLDYRQCDGTLSAGWEPERRVTLDAPAVGHNAGSLAVLGGEVYLTNQLKTQDPAGNPVDQAVVHWSPDTVQWYTQHLSTDPGVDRFARPNVTVTPTTSGRQVDIVYFGITDEVGSSLYHATSLQTPGLVPVFTNMGVLPGTNDRAFQPSLEAVPGDPQAEVRLSFVDLDPAVGTQQLWFTRLPR